MVRRMRSAVHTLLAVSTLTLAGCPARATLEDDSRIAAAFAYYSPGTDPRHTATRCGASFYEDEDVIDLDLPPEELAAQIDDRLAALVSVPCDSHADTPPTFAELQGGAVALDSEGLHLRVAAVDEARRERRRAGVLVLRMHRDAWARLGFDLETNGHADPWPLLKTDRDLVVRWGDQLDTPFAPGVPDPGPDYATAVFTTCPVGEHCTEANSDNRGLTRMWRAGGAL